MNKLFAMPMLALVASLITVPAQAQTKEEIDDVMQGVASGIFAGIISKALEPRRERVIVIEQPRPRSYTRTRERYTYEYERETVREHRPRKRVRRGYQPHPYELGCEQHPWAHRGVLQCDGDQLYHYRRSYYTTHCGGGGRPHPAFEGIGFGIVCEVDPYW